MRIIHTYSPGQTFGLLLSLFIWLTTVTSSEAQGDKNARDTELTKNINKDSSSGGRSGLEDARSQVRGPVVASGNRATKFAVTDRLLYANGDKQQTVLPVPTPRQHAHGASKCLSVHGNALSATHSVTLLRISPQLSASPGPAAPLTFSVDSTITILTIEINSSVPIDAAIFDPNGAMINKRLKREATQPHHYDPKTHFTLHIQRGILSTKKTPRAALPISKLRPTRELRWRYNNQPQRQQLHLNDSVKKKRQANQRQPERPEINYSSVGMSPIKPKLRKRNLKHETQHGYRRENFYNITFPAKMIHQITSQLQQNSETKTQKPKHIHSYQHSRQLFRQKALEKSLLLLNNIAKLTNKLPYYTRNKVTSLRNQQNLRIRYALFKHFNARTMVAERSSGNHRPQLHESNQFVFINQSVDGLQMNQSWNRLQMNRATNAYQINQSVSNIQMYRHKARLQSNQSVDDLLSAVISNYHLKFKENNHHKIRKRQYLKRAGHWNNSHVYTNVQLSRRRRTVSLTTLEDADGADVWQIDPPNTGTWSISILSPEPVQVAVTAISSLDFTFEFLDIRTESRLKWLPIAYDTTLVRLTLTSQSCVANVTVLSLYDDAGETISAVESKDIDLQLDGMASNDKGSVLFWLQMPDVPFYMSAIGYDVTGQRFQRLSSGRVVPRMFALSFVNFRSDPLVPGTDYKFGVRLRNKGGSNIFNIVGTWDNSEYFSVIIIPNTLKVEENQIAHIAVIVSVKPAIYFTVEGSLTVTAYRVSDNVSDTLTETLTGEPSIFLQDYEAPTCSTRSTTGGCRPDIPCHSQHWATSVLVIDSLTGVRSAAFVDAPEKAFTNVKFRFSMTNRTARADYGYTCCNMEATILVSDYANNPSYCKIIAPILDPQTTTSVQYSLVASSTRNNLTPFASPATTSTTVNFPNKGQSTRRPSFVESPSTPSRQSSTFESWQNVTNHRLFTTLTGNTNGKPDSLQSVGQTESTTVRETSSWHVLGGRSTPWISLTSLTSLRRVTEMTSPGGLTNSSAILVEGNRESQHNVDVTQSSTLRLAAIVCGSLAGVAGLAIAVICVIFKCVVKHERHQSRRRRSNDSDVTMGSSSETRSEGSVVSDSWRKSGNDRSIGRSWRGFDTASTPASDVGSGCSTDDGTRVMNNLKQVHLSDECKTRSAEPGRSVEVGNGEVASSRREDSQYFAGVSNGKTTSLRMEDADNVTKARKVASPKGQEVEDVIFRCVFVKKTHKTADGVTGYDPDGGGDEVSQISYSPLLRSGGQTYSSMLQVQKRIEEMDHQRANLSSALRERYDAQPLDAGTPQTAGIKRHNTWNEMSTIPTRLHHYGPGSSCNDVPPGSPQFKDNQGHTPSPRAEISNTQTEVPSECNLPITHHVLSNNLSVPESARNYFQMTTSDQTGPNSHGDTPLNVRTSRESFTQHDIPRVVPNEPIASLNSTSRPAYRTTKTAGVPRHTGLTDRASCTSSIQSPETGSSKSNITPADIGSSRHYADYNQTPGTIFHDRRHFKVSQTGSDNDSYNGERAPEELAYQDKDTRRVHKGKRPGHSTEPAFNQQYLEVASGSNHSQSVLGKLNSMAASETEPCQQPLRLQGQACKSETAVYDNIRASAANEDVFRNANNNDEADEEKKDNNRLIISSAPSTSQTPSNSRSDSPDPRYLQPGTGSRIMSDASQMALRHDLQHIRQKLLKFQRRIDHEIEEESRRSRGNSPCSFDNCSQSEDS